MKNVQILGQCCGILEMVDVSDASDTNPSLRNYRDDYMSIIGKSNMSACQSIKLKVCLSSSKLLNKIFGSF